MAMSHAEAGRLGRIKSQDTQRKIFETRVAAYLSNPTRCRHCNSGLPYKKRKNAFCNQSCAASFNNRVAPKRSDYSSLIKPRLPKRRLDAQAPMGSNICINCNEEIVGWYRNRRMFCSIGCSAEYRIKITNEKIEAGLCSDTKHLRRYLIEKHGHRCLNPNCAWDFDKVHVNVELEHKDGNSTNNNLENLTLLCPNCHSLTPTYKGRNRGKGRAFRRERYAAGLSY